MSLLQFLLIVSSVIFLIFTIDAFQRKKFNALHFIVFFGGGFLIAVFSYDVTLLNRFGQFFGIARGADLLVYIGIILLGYFYFENLNKITRINSDFSRFISNNGINNATHMIDIETTISEYKNNSPKDEYVFLIRAYNEGKTLGEVIDSIANYGFHKIVVVNDGSVDNTHNIIKQKKKQYPNYLIIFITHQINRGGGAANKTGFEFIKRYGDSLGKWIVTFDADGQMDVKDMDVFMKKILDLHGNIDIVLGSRYVHGGTAENIPFLRKIIHFGSKIVTFAFSKLWITDPHNGYRVIHIDALKKIKVMSDGMTYASEFLDEIKRLKLSYTEVPVNIIYTDYSLSKGQKNSNAFKILLELIYKKFFYR